MITQGPEGPAPVEDIVATVYKDTGANVLYVEPLPPQQSLPLPPLGEVGYPVARVWYGLANITPQQQADAEWDYRGPDLDSNLVLVTGHFATVTVRDHRNGDETSEQTWFIVNKLYHTPYRGRVHYTGHSTQFFYATGTTSNAQVIAISRGEQSPRAAHITWTGMAAYGSGGPSSVEDMFVTGQADFTRSPLPIRADEYFVRQTR